MIDRCTKGLLTALLCLGLAVSTPANATKYSGLFDYSSICANLRVMWKAYERDIAQGARSPDGGIYFGYVMGVADTDIYIRFPKYGRQSYEHYAEIVGEWLDRHPGHAGTHSYLCVFWALGEAYGYKNYGE